MKKEGKMVETEKTFHNKTEIRVQAQIFAGRTLVSTCMVDPGEIHILPVNSLPFDIFFKNGATGWEMARKLDSDTTSFALSQHKRRYTIHEAKDNDPLDLVTKSGLAVKRSMKQREADV
jgi:hypothetical protein